MAFDYSTLKKGDSVEVSSQPDFSNPVAATVTKVENDCAFVHILGSPYPPLEFCWHLEDDRLKEGYEQFNYNQELLSGDGQQGPRTGVFIKSRNQELIESLPERFGAIDRLLAKHSALLAAIEEKTGLSEAPRRRGRPPKKPDLVGVDS